MGDMIEFMFAKINDLSTAGEWKRNKKQLELEHWWWEKREGHIFKCKRCVGVDDVSLDLGMICFIN